MKQRIEIAKAWFRLSSLLMMFAGFIFAGAGLAYTSSFNALGTSINLLTSAQQSCLSNITSSGYDPLINLTKMSLDLTMTQFVLWPILINLGVIIAFLSFFAWMFGLFQIWRGNDEH